MWLQRFVETEDSITLVTDILPPGSGRLAMRVPGEGRALRPPTLGWLQCIWIEVEELLCDFSFKPFVGPTLTPQSHHGWCSSADGPSTVLVLRGDIARPMTGHNE